MRAEKDGPQLRQRQTGAALLMTLLLVAALSAAAVALSDSLRLAARRSANAEAYGQAAWYLRGAEELAIQILRRDYEASPDRTAPDAAWAKGPVVFPIDGGRIEGVVTDRSTCFNLNSLVVPEDRVGYVANADAMIELTTLAVALGVRADDAARIAAAAADWIDADAAPVSRGAEDFDYALADPPYRTPNALFAEVEEARALQGMTEELFLALRPLLCAYPDDTAPAAIDINMLGPQGAPLLVALFGGALSREAAEDVIAARPQGGWTSVQDFLALDPLKAIQVSDAQRARLALTSTFFQLDARVYYSGAYAESTSTIMRSGGKATVVARRLGAAE